MPKTDPTHPRPARRGAPLRDRLAQPGRMPRPMPEEAIGTLALIQGLQVELLNALRAQNQDSPVLFHGIVQLAADGTHSRTWDVPFVCVSVANLTGGLVTIGPGGINDPARPPTQGAGVHQVPAGAQGTFAVISTSVGVWGPAGGLVDLGVSTRWLAGF